MIFAKYIKFFLRFSRPILALVAIGTAVLLFFSTQIGFSFSLERLFDSKAPELTHYREFAARFGSDDNVILIAAKSPDFFQPRELEILKALTQDLEGLEIEGEPAVRRALSIHTAIDFAESLAPVAQLYPVREELLEALRKDLTGSPLGRNLFVSGDSRTAGIVVEIDPQLRQDERKLALLLEDVRGRIAKVRAESGLEFHVAGIPVVEDEYVLLIKRDLMTFLPIAMSVFLILLALYFRNITATLLPLIIVMAAIFWTVGWMAIFGVTIGLLTSVFPTLILVIGISDAVHVLSHYQENLRIHPRKRDALAYTLMHMGLACFMTTSTSALGFASLAITDVMIVREFGIITALGIFLAYAATLAIIPAVLDNVPPPAPRTDASDRFPDRALNWVATVNLRYSWWVLGATAIILVASIWGIMQIDIRSSWLQDLKSDHPVHRAHAFVQDNLASAFSADLEIRGELRDLETLRRIDALEAHLQERWGERTRHQMSVVTLIKEANAYRAREAAVAPKLLFGNTKAARKILADFEMDRHRVIPSAEELPKVIDYLDKRAGAVPFVTRVIDPDWKSSRMTFRMAMSSVELQAFVGDAMEFDPQGRFELVATGKSWMAKRALDRVMRDMAFSVLLIGAAFLAMFTVLFRSIKVGLLSMVPNLVPLVVTAGLMGWTGIDLNFSTVTVFTISLGLAVDNSIHFLSRFRTEMVKDQDSVGAIRRTLGGAGRAIVFSSLLLLVGFGSILTSNFQLTFFFGLLGGATILSALFADLFLLPSLLLIVRPKVATWDRFQDRLKRLDEAVERFVRFGPDPKE